MTIITKILLQWKDNFEFELTPFHGQSFQFGKRWATGLWKDKRHCAVKWTSTVMFDQTLFWFPAWEISFENLQYVFRLSACMASQFAMTPPPGGTLWNLNAKRFGTASTTRMSNFQSIIWQSDSNLHTGTLHFLQNTFSLTYKKI